MGSNSSSEIPILVSPDYLIQHCGKGFYYATEFFKNLKELYRFSDKTDSDLVECIVQSIPQCTNSLYDKDNKTIFVQHFQHIYRPMMKNSERMMIEHSSNAMIKQHPHIDTIYRKICDKYKLKYVGHFFTT
jgi:hypothetical protein